METFLSTSIGIGYSQHPDPKEAILEACISVKNQLESTETDLIIIFACPPYIIPEI